MWSRESHTVEAVRVTQVTMWPSSGAGTESCQNVGFRSEPRDELDIINHKKRGTCTLNRQVTFLPPYGSNLYGGRHYLSRVWQVRGCTFQPGQHSIYISKANPPSIQSRLNNIGELQSLRLSSYNPHTTLIQHSYNTLRYSPIANMRTHNLLFGIIAALFTVAHGSGYTAPAYTLKANNQSMLLGYQLYGSQIYNASAVCKDITVASHGVWNSVETWMVQRKPVPFSRPTLSRMNDRLTD
jgi:hypothetical protein